MARIIYHIRLPALALQNVSYRVNHLPFRILVQTRIMRGIPLLIASSRFVYSSISSNRSPRPPSLVGALRFSHEITFASSFACIRFADPLACAISVLSAIDILRES
jgi:hypothetical protein